ncbi:hypothetical protein RRF57_007931 [Xylaria bambusicola]|uniref:Uncharacterized protein n=1 Tax=Xylaria bambusicola TaxID=326684 RepID=A0AAN7UNJ2_9PEZI
MDILEEIGAATTTHSSNLRRFDHTGGEGFGTNEQCCIECTIADSVGNGGCPSPVYTEPTAFIEYMSADPIGLLSEKETTRPTDNEEQSALSEVITYSGTVTEPAVRCVRTLQNLDTGMLSRFEASRQLIQPFPVADEKALELSFSQSLFYFSATFADNQTHLTLTSAFRMTSELRVGDMKVAVLALGKGCESLRTRFFVENSRLM